jgi:hypothetical protein
LKPYSLALVIGIDEDDTCLFQGRPDHGGAGPVKLVLTILETADRAATDAGPFSKFFLGPVEKRARGAALYGAQHDQIMGAFGRKFNIVQNG